MRSWPAYGSLTRQNIDDMEAAEDADPRGKRDPRDFALWKGHKPGEPETASWPTPWGRGRPGWHLECSAMAGKYLGDEFDIHGGGNDLKFPHHENELAQSTAAGQKFARYWMHNAWVTAAGEKMSKSLGNGALVSEVTRQYPPRAVRLYLAQPHYRSAIEFSDTSLDEATASLARIDGFVARAAGTGRPGHAGESRRPSPRPWTTISGPRRRSRRSSPRSGPATSPWTRVRPTPSRSGSARCWECWASSDSTRRIPAWGHTSPSGVEAELAEGLIIELLKQREAARSRRDFDTADAIRDALSALGVAISDTPSGPRWTLPGARSVGDHAGEQPAQGRGTTQRQGQHRRLRRAGPPRPGGQGTHAEGGGPAVPCGLPRQEGGGPARHRRRLVPARTGRPGAGPEWVAGRNSVLEALEAQIPIKTAYVAEGAERDDRLRDILKLAADRGTALLEVTRVQLDRLTGGAVHQGVALQLPAYNYAHPDDLLATALEADSPALVVALDSITDPRNLGAIVRSAAAFGANGVLIPERRSAGMTAAAWKTSAGAAARLPIARATNLNRTLRSYADAGCTLVGLDGSAPSSLGDLDLSGPLVLVVGSEGEGLSRLGARNLRPPGRHSHRRRGGIAERRSRGRHRPLRDREVASLITGAMSVSQGPNSCRCPPCDGWRCTYGA